MFIAVLFIIETGNNLDAPQLKNRERKQGTFTQCNITRLLKEITSHHLQANGWNQKNTILSERSQTQKDKHGIQSLINEYYCKVKGNKASIYKPGEAKQQEELKLEKHESACKICWGRGGTEIEKDPTRDQNSLRPITRWELTPITAQGPGPRGQKIQKPKIEPNMSDKKK